MEQKKPAQLPHEGHWAWTAVVYHIYPLSFKDSNWDGKGDLKGIMENLDYLNDGTQNSLGVNAIWLSPIYKSPMKDFGYDISDYFDIDPTFGDLEIFDKFAEEAHKRKIKIILDFVANHTSEEHPWFKESRASKNNPKRDWYIWRNPKKDGSPPNNWLSFFGGSAWTLDEKTGQYYLHSFLKEQPDLNWQNPEVQKEMLGILKFWLNKGVDGFRVDGLMHILKDYDLNDDPPNPNYDPGKDEPYHALLHVRSQGFTNSTEVVKAFCEVFGERKDAFFINELSTMHFGLATMNEIYKVCDTKLFAPFNFNLLSLPWNARAYKDFIDEFETSLLPDEIPNYVLGNHDRSRIATRLGRSRARVAALLIFTLRGMPFIYYGEELGMKDVEIASRDMLDPYEEITPGFRLGRDPERTPMQWTNEQYAGFSKEKPWLPVSDNKDEVNVKSEMEDSQSILNLYRKLIHYRKNSDTLLYGIYKPVALQNEGNVFAFLREHENKQILVVINFSQKEHTIKMQYKKAKLVCNSFMDRDSQKEEDLTSFTIRGNEGCVFELI